MASKNERVTWSVERRLQFIDFRLFWDQKINRGDLEETFGISSQQASSDFNKYDELNTDSWNYDRSLKSYVPSEQFVPQFNSPNARQYLAQLRAISDEIVTEEESWLGLVPPHDVVPVVRRSMDAEKLQIILKAIHANLAIRIKYQSFSSNNPKLRWITPHALGFDGQRWHLRSWCNNRKSFRDFVISRIISIEDLVGHEIDPQMDAEWQTIVNLKLGPNSKLSESSQRGIEREYGMRNSIANVEIRLSLLLYFERQNGLDLSRAQATKKWPYLTLLNQEEIGKAREEAQNAVKNLTFADL